MKDYSKYIKSEYGFITNIKTNIEENTIEVTTSKSKKGQPHTYVLTKENLEKLYKRLENQYQIIINNQYRILEDYKKERKIKNTLINIIGYTGLFLTVIAPLMQHLTQAIILLISSSSILLGNHFIEKNKEKKFKEELETYDYYIENRKNIESLDKKDNNITININTKTNNELAENQELVNQQLIDETFNIGLMDKISLKELKEILLRYKISKSLEEEQYFHIDEELETKKRALFKK